MSLININRPLLPFDHHELRTHIPEINRLGDLGIKWRRFGEVGVTLVERGEYQRIIESENAALSGVDPSTVKDSIATEIAKQAPTTKGRLNPKILDVRFLGNSRYPSIAYMLDSETLEQERAEITTALDRMNHKNGHWREFEPHLTIATIEPWAASDDVLQAFYDISPEEITLLPAVVSNS